MKTLERNRNRYQSQRLKYKKYLEETWTGLPATSKHISFEMTLSQSIKKSFAWHLTVFIALWAIVTVLGVIGISLKIFPKEDIPMRNIEFILPQKQQPQEVSSKEVPTTTNPQLGTENSVSNNTETSSNTKTKTANKPAHKSSDSSSNFDIPMPDLSSLSSGLVTSNTSTNTSNNSHSSSAFNDTSSSGNTKGAVNATGFDKDATKKMVASFDISPYVNELRRNVQWNWKTSGGRRVELFLRIAKDGRLVILNVKKTSESGNIDEAALNAVRKCLPISPLPSKYPKSYLDVVFIFDGNTVSSSF